MWIFVWSSKNDWYFFIPGAVPDEELVPIPVLFLLCWWHDFRWTSTKSVEPSTEGESHEGYEGLVALKMVNFLWDVFLVKCIMYCLILQLNNNTTGCFRFIVKKLELITQAKKQPSSSDRWHFFLFIGTFWYLVLKKFHNHSVIVHLWRLWRSKTVDICKIHWKLMTFKSQNCFANISATKTPILLKFETYIHKMVKNYQIIYRKDPCTNPRTGGVNVHAHISSRPNTRPHVYAACAHVCARFFTQNHLIILYYLMNISLEFHEDQSFHCGDICKTILTFKTHQCSMYFAYFHKFSPPKPSMMDNYWIIVGFIGI